MRNNCLAMVLLAPVGFAACMDTPEASSDTAASDSASDHTEALAPFQPLLDRVFNATDPSTAYQQLDASDRATIDLATSPTAS